MSLKKITRVCVVRQVREIVVCFCMFQFFLFYFQIVFLQCDRFVEFHSQHGHYYRTRIPRFGRDFCYHYPSCDLYFVGARYWLSGFFYTLLATFSKNKINIKISENLKIGRSGNSFQTNNGDRLRLIPFPALF